jgi:hypothetical protein
MSAGDSTTTTMGRRRKKPPAARKPPPRWRRYLVQAELELPPPVPGAANPPSLVADQELATEVAEAAELPRWQSKPVLLALVLACTALAVLAAWSLRQAAQARSAAAEADDRVQTLTLRAIGSERVLRIAPNPRSWSASADASIAWPEPPQLLRLHLPLVDAGFPSYALVIDKVDQGRVMVVEHVTPDSNRELRLAVNSSAFGPGEYRIRVQGNTWRGQRIDVGWVRLAVDAPR